MKSILYIGIDVHTTNYTICALRPETDVCFAETEFPPSMDCLEAYLESVRAGEEDPENVRFICGYEAGCLGYELYRQMKARGIECRILAPSTMAKTPKDSRRKNDRLDAQRIARCLAHGTYKPVYVTDENDDAVKEYIRMRDDANGELKRLKQQITAFCVRHGRIYDGSKNKWTKTHRTWLRDIKFDEPTLNQTLASYLLRLKRVEEEIEGYDKQLHEFAMSDRYAEKVKRLGCLKGIATHTALSLIVEVGDFNRFPSPSHFAAYLGLTPGEHSSGNDKNGLGITKMGNVHLRRLLVEAAQTFNRGSSARPSAVLKTRQEGNPPELIHYANRANERLRKKYARLMLRRCSNVAKVAVARELACFIWGIMTDHID